jgi:LysW-gamma-L-lysine carboxypeptidase
MRRVLEDLNRLLWSYSPTRHEYLVAGVIADLMRSLGYEKVYIDRVGNVIAEYGTGKTVVALISHMDTIRGKIPVEFKNGVICGRGAVDAKGPLYAMILGAALVKDEVKDKLKVLVIAVTDEEGSSKGAKYLISKGFKADAIVIGEPTNTSNFAIAYRGSIKLFVACYGSGGHPASPIDGGSAINEFINFWGKLAKIAPGDRYFNPQANILYIRSGDASGELPKKADAYLDIRIPPGMNATEFLNKVRSILPQNCYIKVKDVTEPVEVSINKPVVRALIKAMIINGIKPRPVRKYGTSDMNLLYSVTDNIVAYGPGDASLAHTDYECIEAGDVIKVAKVYSSMLHEYSKLS